MTWHPPTGKTWTKGPYRGLPLVLKTTTLDAIADPMQIDRIIIAMQEVITNHLKAGHIVPIPTFGTFKRILNTRKLQDTDTGLFTIDPKRAYYVTWRPHEKTRNHIAGRILP